MSVQQDQYLHARFVEKPNRNSASFRAGIVWDEARMIDEAVARGEIEQPTKSSSGALGHQNPAEKEGLKGAAEAEYPQPLIAAPTQSPAAGEAASQQEPVMADEETGGDAVIEEKKPDFQRAIRILLQDINPAEEANASARGDLSAAWKEIEEGCHVNKAAAKLFNKLRAMSEEKRDDTLRSLYGLMQAGQIGISRDLVDRLSASGEAPTMPVAERQRPKLATVPNGKPPADDFDLSDGDAEESVVDKAARAAAE